MREKGWGKDWRWTAGDDNEYGKKIKIKKICRREGRTEETIKTASAKEKRHITSIGMADRGR